MTPQDPDPFIEPPSAGSLRSGQGQAQRDWTEVQGTLMAVAVEPGRIRGCLLEPISGRHRLAGWLGQTRRADTSVAGQVARLCREMGRRLGRELWNHAQRTPFLASDRPIEYPPIEYFAAALSPDTRLRAGIVALTLGRSLRPARRAVECSPARVVLAQHYTPGLQAQALADALRRARVDALLLTGGSDRAPAVEPSALQAMLRCVAGALEIVPGPERPQVYFAGGQWAQAQAERLLAAAGVAPVVLPNLTPEAGVYRPTILAQALHSQYALAAQATMGFGELAAWTNCGRAPATLESNFARLVRAWRDRQSMSDLHGLYVTPSGCLHVWATEREESVRLYYAPEPEPDHVPEGWPPVTLLSGGAGAGRRLPPTLRWWDPGALGPLVAALGAVAPAAVGHVLDTDVIQPVEPGQT